MIDCEQRATADFGKAINDDVKWKVEKVAT